MSDADIIAELEAAVAAGDAPDGFYSTVELCAMLGRQEDAVRRRLKLLKRAGRLEERYLMRPNELGPGSTRKLCFRVLPASGPE